MNDAEIRYVIDRGLEYFDPLPIDEIAIRIIPVDEWLRMGLPQNTVACSMIYPYGTSNPNETPTIFLLEDFEQRLQQFAPGLTPRDVPLHELSHIVDVVLTGQTSQEADVPYRNQITTYIVKQEGWSS